MGVFEFSDQERRIFRHLDDDHAWVYVDPQVVQRRLNRAAREATVDLAATIEVFRRDAESRLDAAERHPMVEALAARSVEDATEDLVPLIHAAFLTSPLGKDGRGLTEAEAMGNLDAFFEFVASLKKSTATSPDSSPSARDSGPGPASSPTSRSSAS